MWYQRSLLKYAEDMALVAWMSDEQSLVTYRQFVDPMVLQFLESLLQVNISKTEELCWGGLVVNQDTFWTLRLISIDLLHNRQIVSIRKPNSDYLFWES